SSGEFTTTMNQKSTYVCLPVTVEYRFSDKKYRPYLLAGVSPDYLVSSKQTLAESRQGFTSVESASGVPANSAIKLNVSAFVGAGIRERVAGGFFITELRYKYGFSNVTKISDTYSNDAQVLSYKYTDAIYKINGASLSIGYVQNFFNPKKLK